MNSFLSAMTAYGADAESAVQRCAGDVELYEECVRIFSNDEAFLSLYKALEQREWSNAFDEAHTLKGVAANLSLTPLYEAICALVEPLRREELCDYTPLEAAIQAEHTRLLETLSALSK